MFSQRFVVKNAVFVAGLMMLGIGLFLWSRDDTSIRLEVTGSSSLIVAEPEEAYLVPVSISNDGLTDVRIVGSSVC